MGHRQEVHLCSCPICQQHRRDSAAREHRAINRLLAVADERLRRLLVGFFALQRGPGGIVELERITGIDRNTISKGRREVCQATLLSPDRIRRPGAGRRKLEDKRPGW